MNSYNSKLKVIPIWELQLLIPNISMQDVFDTLETQGIDVINLFDSHSVLFVEDWANFLTIMYIQVGFGPHKAEVKLTVRKVNYDQLSEAIHAEYIKTIPMASSHRNEIVDNEYFGYFNISSLSFSKMSRLTSDSFFAHLFKMKNAA